MSACSPDLLAAAIVPSESAATAAWQRWRGSVDIQQLAWQELQFLPVIPADRLNGWLAEDPAAGVLKGIVRRAWTEAQLRLAQAERAIATVAAAGCFPATLFGPPAVYLHGIALQRIAGASVRAITEIRILLPRQQIASATAALVASGWHAYSDAPAEESLDWHTHTVFSCNNINLYLHWRALEAPGPLAAVCEAEFLAEFKTVDAMGKQFRLLPPGLALLEILAGKPHSEDLIPWQADAALILREHLDEIHWVRWVQLADEFGPGARSRVDALRDLGFAIPTLPAPIVLPLPPAPRSIFFLRRWKRSAFRIARRLLTPSEAR